MVVWLGESDLAECRRQELIDQQLCPGFFSRLVASNGRTSSSAGATEPISPPCSVDVVQALLFFSEEERHALAAACLHFNSVQALQVFNYLAACSGALI